MKLYIACPSYDGHATVGLKKSLEETLKILPSDIEIVDFDILSGCCYLPIARNKLVRRFMDSEADEFLFLDSDISWPFPNEFIKFLRTDSEVVAGLYRYKTWDHSYPCNLICDDDGIPLTKDGLIKAYGVPTGCLKIQRKAFKRMIDFYGEDLEVDNPDDDLQPKFAYWNFFDTEKVGRTWVGEDYNFCRYFQHAGGEVWVYPNITLNHYGRVYVIDKNNHVVLRNHSFTGNFHEFMLRRPGGLKSGPANPMDYEVTDIDGWMTKIELQFLYQESSKYNSVIEIGSFKGRSTHAILSGMANHVVCIDPWNVDSPVENIFSGEKEYQTFLKNVEPFQCNGRLRVIRGYSHEVAPDIGMADMVFIDGDHTYESVRRDIDLYLPKARHLICGHDYADWPGVIQAVNETFGDRVRLIDSIWYVELDDATEKREVQSCYQ